MKNLLAFVFVMLFGAAAAWIVLGLPAQADSPDVPELPPGAPPTIYTDAFNPLTPYAPAVTAGDPDTGSCHFAITIPGGLTGYDLNLIGAGYALNWGQVRPSAMPDDIEYFHVLRVATSLTYTSGTIPDVYVTQLANLPGWLAAAPGQHWIIGNEPDARVPYQDSITPELYGQRFYEMATLIRQQDPTAKIGFGGVIQPTPLRQLYLQATLDVIDQQHASGDANQRRQQTLALIDFIAAHAFLLPEDPSPTSSGARVPYGMETAYETLTTEQKAYWRFCPISDPECDDPDWTQTHNFDRFEGLVTDFRAWLYDKGMSDKPWYITEYGSLLPPLDPPLIDFMNTPDAVTRDYMLATFDFLLTATDPTHGYAPDANRLVQRAFWFSLNNDRTAFGGALYDPTDQKITPVGTAYLNYDPSTSIVGLPNPDVFIKSISATPVLIDPQGDVEYALWVRVGNSIRHDARPQVTVTVWEDDTKTTQLGTGTGKLARCGGDGLILVRLPGHYYTPGTDLPVYIEVSVDAVSGSDPDTTDNTSDLVVPLQGTPNLVALPMLQR